MEEYVSLVSQPFKDFYFKNIEWFNTARHTHHPGKQKEIGGLKLHTLQVVKKALELNQEFPENEIIEVCLVHDIKGCEELPLTDRQRIAIEATKGLPYSEWRKKPDYRFTVLILIADMWSAFINIKNL